jgi:demethylmenaquinone methyltransferase/2-methoxy-6-polyprenyl-1,4-benzoquinol methylase
MLALAYLLTEPAIRSAIWALPLPPDSRGLDAGCGIGLHIPLLVKAVAPGGHVTGLDLSPAFLERAEAIAGEAGVSEHTRFREGDLNRLPFDDGTFDWVWSVDTVWPGPKEWGCPAKEPLPLVSELARVVKPGGIVAIVFWSSQKLLPGYPLLEARLNVTSPANAPFTQGMRPEVHCLRALGWLHDARLQEPTARTFVADVHAPLSDDIRSALTATFQMFWGETQPEVTPEDWAEFQRLCQPASPDFILNLPDYYAFLTYSLFYGRVA